MTLFTFLVPLSVTRTKGHPIRRITSFKSSETIVSADLSNIAKASG